MLSAGRSGSIHHASHSDPADGRYEATCRFFRSRKPAPEPSLAPELKRHPNHNSLIEEAEEELHALSWPELMTAGGLAGVTAWLVSRRRECQSRADIRLHSPLTCSRRACRL